MLPAQSPQLSSLFRKGGSPHFGGRLYSITGWCRGHPSFKDPHWGDWGLHWDSIRARLFPSSNPASPPFQIAPCVLAMPFSFISDIPRGDFLLMKTLAQCVNIDQNFQGQLLLQFLHSHLSLGVSFSEIGMRDSALSTNSQPSQCCRHLFHESSRKAKDEHRDRNPEV